jgi:hypothetical protein
VREVVGAAALVVALAACGSTEPTKAGGRCSGSGDTIAAPNPVVRVSSELEACTFEVSARRSIRDGSVVKVRRGEEGSGRASLVFADVGLCDVLQLQADKPAVVVTRFPEGALFQQRRGMARCTLQGRVTTICQGRNVELRGGPGDDVSQARIRCDPDPILSVAAYRGTVTVALGTGEDHDLQPGQEFNLYPEPTSTTPAPEVVGAEFTSSDVATFERQAEAMGVGFEPLRPTPTVSPTPTPTVTATDAPPVNVVPPAVRWHDFGETVASDLGRWEGEPSSFSITWGVACRPDGSACRSTGVLGDVYSIVYNDDCYYVRSIVTATNTAGSTAAASAPFDISCID